MLYRINFFILSVIFFELVSLLVGFGTHFDYYKYAIMLSIVILNYIALNGRTKLELIEQFQNPTKRS